MEKFIILIAIVWLAFVFRKEIAKKFKSETSANRAPATTMRTVASNHHKNKRFNPKPGSALNVKLFEAIKPEDIDAIRTLIAKGADVNAKDQYKRSALWCALSNPFSRKFHLGQTTKAAKESFRKSKQIVLFLIENGADINAKNRDGNTPLMIAQTSSLMKLRINKGADVNVRDS